MWSERDFFFLLMGEIALPYTLWQLHSVQVHNHSATRREVLAIEGLLPIL